MSRIDDKVSPENCLQDQKHDGNKKGPRKPVLSVIIVNYNVKEFLQQALNSLQLALSAFTSEVFVVDNASSDGSVEMLRREFPDIKVIENKENTGFAKANNQALRQARGEYITLLNPDTIVHENTFETLVAFMEKTPDAGMAGCKVLNPDGTIQLACRRSFPTPWIALTRLLGLSYLFPKNPLFGRYNLTYLPEDEVAAVEAISGSFMMLRRSALRDVGFLDETFFLYGEDLDWCFRVNESGWKIYYFPDAKIIHFKGESSKQNRLDNLLVFNRAMALFVKKHFRKRYFFITYYALLIAIWTRTAFTFIKDSLYTFTPLIIDFVFLQGALALSLIMKFGDLQNWMSYLPVNAVYSLAWLACLALLGSYRKWRFSFFRSATAIVMGFFFNSALTYFFNQYAFSRAVLLMAAGFSLVTISGWRLVFKLLHLVGLAPFKGTFGHTLLARRTLVVGDFQRGERVLEKLKSRIGDGYDIIGLVSISDNDVGKTIGGWKVVASINTINTILVEKNIQEIIFSTQKVPYNTVLKIITRKRDKKVVYKLVPNNLDVIIGKASIDRLTDTPLMQIEYRLSGTGSRILKRGFDLTLSLSALIVLLPFWLVFWARNRKRAVKHKIRIEKGTTVEVAEIPDGGWRGRILWLWPVVRGTFSIVGRPIALCRINRAADANLKLGLTGLIQINRKKRLSRHIKEQYQLFYMTNYSILLDLEIILRAVLKI